MKNSIKILTFLVSMNIILFTSCVKEKYTTPKQIIPDANLTANLTIAQLKTTYSGTGSLDHFGDTLIVGSDTIIQPVIQGIVNSTDESGNLYKTLYIQDNTGGIQIAVDRTSLYINFKVGQRVFVKLSGMYMGDYGGVIQLGYIYDGGIGRLPDVLIDSHLFCDSLPGAAPTPLLRTAGSVSANDYSMLIKIRKVHFVEADSVFSSTIATTDRVFTDSTGVSMILRTSNYASFRSNLLPSGEGTIIGVLSNYNGTNQLYLRDLNDIQDWVPDTMKTLINESFASSLGTFASYSVTGAQVWTQYTTPGAITCAKMSGYSGGNIVNEDWLISNSVNLDSYQQESFSFNSAMKYGSPTDGSLIVYYSTDYTSGNPTTATWTIIPVSSSNLPTGADWNFVSTGNIDVSTIPGSNVHFAFKYTSTTSSAATWEITAIKLRAKPN